jgi:hypothetical protein
VATDAEMILAISGPKPALPCEIDDQPDAADQAELGQLGDQGGESPVQIRDEAHGAAVSFRRRRAHAAPSGR